MKRIFGVFISIAVLLILIVGGFISALPKNEIEMPDSVNDLLPTPVQTPVDKEEPKTVDHLVLTDNLELYPSLSETKVITAYITVRRGNISDNTDHSWEEVDHATKANYEESEFQEVPKAEVIFQIGNEIGPQPGEFGFNDSRANGTIQVRGNSASKRSLKSYKVELRNWTGGWNGQYTLALNKHAGDISRIKNKLCYDLLIGQPDTISLRTQFFHLYVKDETQITEGEVSTEIFRDMGLFTMVEQPNKTFLRSHELDPNAQFYKANYFEFFRYPDHITTVDDSDYDLNAFEDILEVKGNNNHTKLIEMIEAINDPRIPIEDTFEYYFDSDNYFMWMAFNILVGNIDTSSQNFYLYSPQASHKWYFIPWDFDGTFNKLNLEEFGYNLDEDWQEGIQTYWGVTLHRRVLSDRQYRERLDEKIEYWMTQLTPERFDSLLSTYRPLTEPYLTLLPDVRYFDQDEYEFAYNTFYDEVENNYQLYKNSLIQPMPFFIGDPTINDKSMTLAWDASYDFQDTDITYHVQISKDIELKELIVDEEVLNFTQITIDKDLPVGAYFLKISASDPDGNTQSSYGRYVDTEKVAHNGMLLFYIQRDLTGKTIRLVHD